MDGPDDDGAGVFYPRDADTAEERLQFYASRFPVVEVDATYYALPNERTSQLWVERTPPDFVFDIKAHALMTGQPTETKRLPKDIREALPAELAAKSRLYNRDLPEELQAEIFKRFREGIEPLRAAGQLGAIFLQYPRWFFPVSESRDTILEAVMHLDGFNVAVEFRHGSWFNEKNRERTLGFLSEHDIALVVVDGPQGFKSSMPPVVAATSLGARRRALPRPADRDLGSEGRPDGRALPLPVRPGRARRVGTAGRRARVHGR